MIKSRHGKLFCGVLLACSLWTYGAHGQNSLLDKLESESQPVQNGKGQVETDIKPGDVIHWTLAGHQLDQAQGLLKLTLSLTTEQQFTIYTDKLKFETNQGWKLLTQKNPKTSRQYDPISRKEVDVYEGGAFDLSLKWDGATEDALVTITYVGCTKVICLFPHSEKIQIPVDRTSLKKSVPVAAGSPTVEKPLGQKDDPPPPATSPAKTEEVQNETPAQGGSVEEIFASRVKNEELSFTMLLLIAFIGGLLTNLTPCVAPMIPITIRLLAHQTIKPIISSSTYALGIVATYTSLGVVAALSGALFGNLISHPAVSITFGVFMALLGLNMVGFGDLSRLQQIGGRIGSSKGGALNSFLMGAGAGLVASPCTGPILAALLTYTAGRQNIFEAISLLGVYSSGFALPYIFLGASAAKLSQIRVRPHIQILTKMVFAGVMFGLSLYFLRIPLYTAFMALKPYWTTLGIIGLTTGVFGILVVLSKDALHNRKPMLALPALFLGVGLFFGIQGLLRPATSDTATIQWIHSEKEAFELSQQTGKPIIVDSWAEWCEACKKMDITTFVDPEVVAEISAHWIPLKFDLTESNDVNSEIQERYELPGLPTTTFLPVGGDLKRKIQVTGYIGKPSMMGHLKEYHSKLSSQEGHTP